jgi:DNA-binding response OmpR family regulator
MAEEKQQQQLGRILLKRKLISQDELDNQLEEQKSSQDGVPLASRIAQSGTVSETEVLRALSEQLGVPGIDLLQVTIPVDVLALVPRDVAEARRILLVLAHDDRLFLAMASPSDRRAIDELEFVTGRKVYPYVSITTTLDRAIRDAYDAKDAGLTHYVGPNAPPDALERALAERAGPASTASQAKRERESVSPGAPSVVVDEKVSDAAAKADFSTAEFGSLAEEISKIGKPESPPQSAAKGRNGAKKVLVVDDEEEIRNLVRRLFTEQGHQVIEADKGLMALRLVKDEAPDLIVLDAMLPEVHGFDIAKRIRGSEKYGAIPILMMSAVYRGWRIKADLKANYGIEDFIEKPFRIAELVAKAKRLLERSALDRPAKDPDPEEMNRSAATCLEEGIAAYKSGNIELAIVTLRKGISVDPLAYRLRYHLALIYGKQGLIFDAIAELEGAVDLHPAHFAALKNLAVLYEKAGFRHKAVEVWERSMRFAPDPLTAESIKAHVEQLS